jgi:Rod binding domain-containing protein
MIDGISSALAAAVPQTPARPKDDPKKVTDAAHQFEALLIGQMLKGMRESEGGWMGTGDDQSMSSAMEYAQEMFAQSMSASGGLGLAKVVASGFNTTAPAKE